MECTVSNLSKRSKQGSMFFEDTGKLLELVRSRHAVGSPEILINQKLPKIRVNKCASLEPIQRTKPQSRQSPVCERLQRTKHLRTLSKPFFQTMSEKDPFCKPKKKNLSPKFSKPKLTDSKIELEKIESNINQLINKGKSLKFMTYQKWKKRNQDNLPDMFLEKKYSQKIAAAKNKVYRTHSQEMKSLKDLVRSMNKIVYSKSISPDAVLRQAVILLLKRAKNKHSTNSTKLFSFKEINYEAKAISLKQKVSRETILQGNSTLDKFKNPK